MNIKEEVMLLFALNGYFLIELVLFFNINPYVDKKKKQTRKNMVIKKVENI